MACNERGNGLQRTLRVKGMLGNVFCNRKANIHIPATKIQQKSQNPKFSRVFFVAHTKKGEDVMLRR